MTRETITNHRGFDISLDHRNYTFRVEGDDFVEVDAKPGEPYPGREFESLKAARAAIDAHLKTGALKTITDVKIAARVLDEHGVPMTVVGLHRGNGKAKVEGYAASNQPYYEGEVYPALEWVGEALRRIDAIREELDELHKRLRPLAVSLGRWSWSKQIKAEQYAGVIRRLKEELAEAEEKARPDAVPHCEACDAYHPLGECPVTP